jgi:hypothetical protein
VLSRLQIPTMRIMQGLPLAYSRRFMPHAPFLSTPIEN